MKKQLALNLYALLVQRFLDDLHVPTSILIPSPPKILRIRDETQRLLGDDLMPHSLKIKGPFRAGWPDLGKCPSGFQEPVAVLLLFISSPELIHRVW